MSSKNVLLSRDICINLNHYIPATILFCTLFYEHMLFCTKYLSLRMTDAVRPHIIPGARLSEEHLIPLGLVPPTLDGRRGRLQILLVKEFQLAILRPDQFTNI